MSKQYHIGIRAYSEVNIKYFYPVTFRIILITKTVKKNPLILFKSLFIKKVVPGAPAG